MGKGLVWELKFGRAKRKGGKKGGLQGRSGTVALFRVNVVLRGLVWLRARRVERAVLGRRSMFAMVGNSVLKSGTDLRLN